MITVEASIEHKFYGIIRGMIMGKKIWTPYKIWNETQWFDDINKIMKKSRKKKAR